MTNSTKQLFLAFLITTSFIQSTEPAINQKQTEKTSANPWHLSRKFAAFSAGTAAMWKSIDFAEDVRSAKGCYADWKNQWFLIKDSSRIIDYLAQASHRGQKFDDNLFQKLISETIYLNKTVKNADLLNKSLLNAMRNAISCGRTAALLTLGAYALWPHRR